MAQPFDVNRLVLTGEPVPVADQVQTSATTPPMAIFSASQTGVLAYQAGAGATGSQLTWFDRSGKTLGTLGDPAGYGDVELSPDGKRVAVSILDRTQRTRDIWIVDVARGLRARFTFDPADELTSSWSPDGSRIAFNSRRKDALDLYQKPSNLAGSEELLLADDRNKYPMRWSRDGRFLPYVAASGGGGVTAGDVWVLSLADRKSFPYLNTSFAEAAGQLSPDGLWMAYTSNESKSNQIYVTPFPGPGGKWLISTTGGHSPRWRDDGREIFYLSPDNRLMAASVSTTDSAFEVGEVRPLFQTRHLPGPRFAYDVSKDGQRFLINTVGDSTESSPITVVVNWLAELKK